jgi:hypothetical protein
MKQKTTYISPLSKDGLLRKLSIFKPLSMLLLILLFGVNNILGQTYTQITTLGALVDGDYLVVGDAANDGMMTNTATATPFINFSAVTNPGSSISSGFTSSNVFQITVVSGQITIYNSSVGYVSWGRTGNIGNTATFFNGTVANTEQWTPTVSGGLWTLSNVATPGRSLQWNSASPRFACYTSAQTRLKLYKSSSSATITGAATATAFTTTYGAPSTAQTFSVSGSGLTSDITATAPTGFEVSNGGAYGATTTFTQSGGTASGTLSVRLKANAAVTGSYNSQNIVLSSTGATNVNVTTAASGNSVTAAALTISGISSTNKIYNASAIGSLTGTATYVGLQNSESFSVTGTPVATFAQSTIGTGIGVTVTGYTAPSTNYLVSQPSVSNADITAKPLTISGLTANNKVFDNNTTATLSGTASLVGVETADVSNVTLGGTYVADFVSSAVGTGIAVTVTGYTLSGSAAGNYSLTQPTGLTADITSSPSPVINSSLTATETYGVAITTYTITATNTPTSFNSVGLPAGLSVNTSTGEITGTPTAVGTYTVTISATNAGGTGNANFVYTINPKGLTVTGATADTKVYDGNTTATISGSTLVGIVGADVVTINTSGTFDTKNVGTGKVVTSTQTLGGADAAKYTVTIPTGLTADITPIALTISSAVAQNKVFDGNTTATITGTLSGVVSPDVVTLTLSGTFATSAIGTGIVVTSTSTIGGADVANYTLTQPTGLTANINLVPTFTEVIFPQFIQGTTVSSNPNRIPFAYRATLSNLTPNATYRFYNSVELTSALPTAQGAGNNIFTGTTQGSNFSYSTGSSLSTTGNYGTFTTDANGSYTGWFIITPTGNATRFVPGTLLNTRIVLNDGNNGVAPTTILKSNQTITVINTVASAGVNNGTGLWGASSATDKNFVFVYDDVSASNRPLSGTFVENDGAAQVSSFATFYTANVNGTSGRYGMIVPNTNPNGVRRIEQRDFTTGAIVGCPAIDSNGVWPSGANTVNPTGGTNAIAITSTDAPLNPSCTPTSSSTTVNICASAVPYSWNSQSFTTSGTYTFTTSNSCGCDSTATLNLTVNALPTVTASASSTTLCLGDNLTLTGGGATSYAWSDGTNTPTDATPFAVTAGTSTYTVTGTDGNSCTATSTVGITVTNCSVTLDLTAFIEGYYDVALAEMRTPLFTTGTTLNANDCENLTVELHHPASTVGTPIVLYTFTGVLQKNGTLTCTFPGTVVNNSYYIVISSPNTIKTWSANPYLFDPLAIPYAYNFSTAATQAYGNNMIEVSTGRWAVFSGDIDQLNGADLNDFTSWQTDYDNFTSGYYPTDLDGDGSVGLSDFTIWQANFDAFASEVGP